eukprot:Skav210853  [mRNA]  locus=scaffold2829:177304:179528:- [translate_table: standard]
MMKKKTGKAEAGARMAAAHRARMETFTLRYSAASNLDRCFAAAKFRVTLPLEHAPGGDNEGLLFPDDGDVADWGQRMAAALEIARPGPAWPYWLGP